VVSQQDQKSQLQNKLKAMEVLRARLLDRMIAEAEAARSAERRAMVGTGDRSGKIRTYNFPQSRITDHRINLSVHNLTDVLEGKLDELVAALRMAARSEQQGE
jgi:peptide chain release factor 1